MSDARCLADSCAERRRGLTASDGYDSRMNAADANTPRTSIRVLLYSDDSSTREAVRLAVGRRPAKDVEITDWLECATAPAVYAAVEGGGFDLLILDGEAAKVGGMGVCRELKNSVYECPPVLVLTGRPQDAWLATWSQADAVVPHPLDPIAVASTVAHLARTGATQVRSY